MMTIANSVITKSARNRLAWQCRRGMRELDELLKSFLGQHLGDLDESGQQAFENLLQYPDAVLLELLMGRMAPADREVATIVQKIRNTSAS